MNMNKVLAALLILISNNCFADLQYDLDKMEQERRLNAIETRIEEQEYTQHLDDNEKFFDELHEKITRVG